MYYFHLEPEHLIESVGVLKKNQVLPKDPGRIIAIAPARPRKGTLLEKLPADVSPFEPKDLMSIFSPSAVAPPSDASSSSPDLTAILARLAALETSNKKQVDANRTQLEVNRTQRQQITSLEEQLKETKEELKETKAKLDVANAKIEILEGQ
ncbi:hypothetical protein H0H93_002157, partial [Arthromyces matolae]